MEKRTALPLQRAQEVGRPERSDAARNRESLLETARRIIAAEGVDALTMDRLAADSGLGKGTVFRRFESKAGLFTALLDSTEKEFQRRYIFGPPPLGPGSPPVERLVAYGRERIRVFDTQSDLLREADAPAAAFDPGASGAGTASEAHIAMLLRQSGADLDVPVTAFMLLAALRAVMVLPRDARQRIGVARLADGWESLVRSLLP
ncbi:TetR/AcrR family transcriptional regulator [Cnuibacter physcomitrellae]|uniref:TetR/AcrR family transcriptional regulator n=1 Tax=Cnuibacter physcomitrellae TaxID=1619308 RepID=UPI002175DD2B|nr:TetR/AcrR family transcriptional regulator [Cnuibacter physcomitrellae]MCS5497977.1 TetR/AcrR family transcriptional regulator [Cnuibacter physcomitrellae]